VLWVQVKTLPSVRTAALDTSHEAVARQFFGRSPGSVHFLDSDLLIALQARPPHMSFPPVHTSPVHA